MKGKINIFDLSDLSDLSSETKLQLAKKKDRRRDKDEFGKQILRLFEKAGIGVSLDFDQLVVGYSRMYGETKKRAQLIGKTNAMSKYKNPKIRRACNEYGRYELI